MPHQPLNPTPTQSVTARSDRRKTYMPVASLLAMTAEHDFAISRHDLPEVCSKTFRPLVRRAQGRPGARRTRGLACQCTWQKAAHEHTGSAGASRPSLRNGFTAYFVLFPENGSFASVARASYRKLNASTAAPEPHDFAVRSSHTRQSQLSRPSHLTARS